jgi:hypothetical protein
MRDTAKRRDESADREQAVAVGIGDAMGAALLQLMPLALAAALSSVPITATVFILLSESRTRSGIAFLAGTVLGTFAVIALATVASEALPGRPHKHEDLVEKLEVVIGLVMVVLGALTLARRTPEGKGRDTGWMEGIGSTGPLPVLGIGLALNLRPKAVLLAGAAGLGISGAHLHFDENVVLVGLYTAVATSTVVVPIVAALLFPRQTKPYLVSAQGWITAHSRAVGATILIAIGGFVTGIGLVG